MLVKDAMKTEFVSALPSTPMLEAHALMDEKRVRVLPVVDEKGSLVGKVTTRTVLQQALPKFLSPGNLERWAGPDLSEFYRKIRELEGCAVASLVEKVTPDETIELDEPLMQATFKLVYQERAKDQPDAEILFVVDGFNHLVGILSPRDIRKAILKLNSK